jgi:hypothetical protein
MPAGPHGGNMDDQMNGIGATIYLPVSHPGGLLSIGDMHAAQVFFIAACDLYQDNFSTCYIRELLLRATAK